MSFETFIDLSVIYSIVRAIRSRRRTDRWLTRTEEYGRRVYASLYPGQNQSPRLHATSWIVLLFVACLMIPMATFANLRFEPVSRHGISSTSTSQKEGLRGGPIERITPPTVVGVPIKEHPLCLDFGLWYDSKGAPMLVGCSYLAGSVPFIFYVDAISGKLLTTKPVPAIRNGPYNVSVSQKTNTLFIASVGNKRLFYYNLESGTLRSTPVIDPKAIYIFGVTASPWGIVYFATSRSKEHGYANLYSFDQSSGHVRKLLNLPGEMYIKPMLVAGDHEIIFGASGERESEIYLYNAMTDHLRGLLQPADTSATWVYNLWGGQKFLVAKLIGPRKYLLFRRDSQTHKWRWRRYLDGAHSVASGGHRSVLENDSLGGYIIRNGRREFICGLTTTFKYWRRDVNGQNLRFSKIDVPLCGTLIHNLTTVSDSMVYGGTYETNSLFRVNVFSRKITDFGSVHPSNSGEINAIVPIGRKLYIFSYTHSEVCVYNPEKEWQVGEVAHPNPRYIGRTGPEQYRPLSATLGQDGKIYVGSMPDYNRIGGALASIDPLTDSITTMRFIDGNCSVASVASGDGLVFAGSTIYGSNGDRIEFKEPPHLVVYDPVSGKVKLVEVNRRAASITCLVYTGHELIGTVNLKDGKQELFEYPPKKKRVKVLFEIQGQHIRDLFRASDAQIYGYTAGVVFRLSLAADSFLPLVDSRVDPSVRNGIDATTIDSEGHIWYGIGDTLKECSIIGFRDKRGGLHNAGQK